MHPQAMLSVCTQHCGTALGQATAQTTHSVLHEEREYTVLQELGPPMSHSNPHIPPWKEAWSVSPSLLWGWEAANVLQRPSPNKAPHTDPAKGPGSSLLIAILASEPTRGKQRGPYFLW